MQTLPVEPQNVSLSPLERLHTTTQKSQGQQVHVVIGQAFGERCVGSTTSRSDEPFLALLVAFFPAPTQVVITYCLFFSPLRHPRRYVSMHFHVFSPTGLKMVLRMAYP